MFGWLRKPTKQEQAVPDWLAVAIDRAVITERSQDDEGNPRIMVKVAGMGSWYFDGIGHSAKRIERHTGLPPVACRTAARLLADSIASKNLARARGKGSRKNSFVFNGWDSL